MDQLEGAQRRPPGPSALEHLHSGLEERPRGAGLGQPGAGKALGHPQQPQACGEGIEKMEPGSLQWHAAGG